MNPVSYTIATGTTASVARGMEVNAGVLGNSTAAEAYGIIIATNGLSGAPYFTVPGTVKSYIQVQVTGGADIAAAPANGFVFNSGGGVNAIQTGGSLITVNGSTTAGFELNLEALNASNAAFAMHNNNFVTGSSADTNYRLNAIGFTADDLLSIGHACVSGNRTDGHPILSRVGRDTADHERSGDYPTGKYQAQPVKSRTPVAPNRHPQASSFGELSRPQYRDENGHGDRFSVHI